MRKIKYQLVPVLCALLLLLLPLRADAAWKAQAIPAGGVETTLSDSRYIDPAFILHKVTFSWQGNDWVMGMDALKDMPVRLLAENGQITCTLLDTSVLDAYLGAVNVQLAAQTVSSGEPVFADENGTYIYRGGQISYKLTENAKTWLVNTLTLQACTNSWTDLSLALDENFVTTTADSNALTLSPDFIVAGTCTTSYKTSGANRCNNVAVAASRFNNLVVMPGQTVSVSETILPRTTANGYKESDVYMDGKTVRGIGGGVCQVSSTVYNAVMNAGLTVLERKPHSMPITYLPQGMDAAIATGYKDMKFRNDYSTPVVITTATVNKKLTVNVMVPSGVMNGRSYKLWAKQTGELSAKTYLTTYQDGVEVSTKYIGSSSYKPHKKLGED